MRTLEGGAVIRVRPAAAPKPLRRVGRYAYAHVSKLSAPLRLEPGFVLIGIQRCGTTSLFRALSAHPQLAAPSFWKGVNYFDLNYYRGTVWYRSHFPVAETARRKAARYGPPVAFEASGYYAYHPCAMERLARDMPAMKLAVMLRDPVVRAYSAYKHEHARGFEQESFERALELEDDRLRGEDDRMREDPTYESFSHRHQSYRHRGHYAEQLERVFKYFPREQVHVIDSAEYFSQPGQEYGRLLAFLGLRPFEPPFSRWNARAGGPMPARARQLLEGHYPAHDKRLAELLGRPLSWMG
jgi:hypothetical protein